MVIKYDCYHIKINGSKFKSGSKDVLTVGASRVYDHNSNGGPTAAI
jgi:hypothetical protein